MASNSPLAFWIVSCVDNENVAQIRAEHLVAHRAYLASKSDILLVAGAKLTDDGQSPIGSHFLVAVESRAQAEEFIHGDPFYQNGVFAEVAITRMKKGQWNPHVADGVANKY